MLPIISEEKIIGSKKWESWSQKTQIFYWENKWNLTLDEINKYNIRPTGNGFPILCYVCTHKLIINKKVIEKYEQNNKTKKICCRAFDGRSWCADCWNSYSNKKIIDWNK